MFSLTKIKKVLKSQNLKSKRAPNFKNKIVQKIVKTVKIAKTICCQKVWAGAELLCRLRVNTA